MKLINIIKKLYPFDYSIAGQGNDIAIKEFMKLLQFKVHSFKSGLSHNGWKIPHSCLLKKGLIKDGKKIIFDAKKKNLLYRFNLQVFQEKLTMKN